MPSFGNDNVLVQRFQADEDFQALYEDAKTALSESLFASGTATEILERRADVLRDEASDLVDAETITTEAGVVSDQFTAE